MKTWDGGQDRSDRSDRIDQDGLLDDDLVNPKQITLNGMKR